MVNKFDFHYFLHGPLGDQMPQSVFVMVILTKASKSDQNKHPVPNDCRGRAHRTKSTYFDQPVTPKFIRLEPVTLKFDKINVILRHILPSALLIQGHTWKNNV